MSLGTNLQYLRHLCGDMTQEELAQKLNVTRQTVSKWEMDISQPEIPTALEICRVFNCTMDNIFRNDLGKRGGAYSKFRTESVKAFRYIPYTVISTDPEGDALNHVYGIAERNGVKKPKVIGWDFPNLSVEQINVYNMHGYTAAWVLPEEFALAEGEIKEQPDADYAAVHIERPFDNPFVTIPGAYQALNEYMKINGLVHTEEGVIPCFETDGETMDIYIAYK